MEDTVDEFNKNYISQMKNLNNTIRKINKLVQIDFKKIYNEKAAIFKDKNILKLEEDVDEDVF